MRTRVLLCTALLVAGCRIVDPREFPIVACQSTADCAADRVCCAGACRLSCTDVMTDDGGLLLSPDGTPCLADLECASGHCVDVAGQRVCGATCQAGTTCTTNPGAPCLLGVTQCEGGVASCADGAPADDGTSCGATQLCVGGACVPCQVGLSCSTNSEACKAGVTACEPEARCDNTTTSVAPGTSCGMDQVCNPAGECVSCQSGASCTGNPSGPCKRGVVSCQSGMPVCTDGPDATDGTTCGLDEICRAGACVACVSGQSCGTNPQAPCKVGTISCGATIECLDGINALPGTACGTDQVCNGNGQCLSCTAGAPCTTNPGAPCRAGITSCTTGAPTCIDGNTLPAGTSCGTDQVCDSSATCVACVANAACAVNPSACRTGRTSCTTGTQTCVDFGNKPSGTMCGATDVCDGMGFCGACVANQPCTNNPNAACLEGVTSCSTGTTTCIDSAPKPNGTLCGTARVCFNGACSQDCAAGTSCTNPNVCKTGVISCSTGMSACVDASNKPAGTACGSNQVCDGSGACAACTAGTSCTTNPAPCRTGVSSCTTGSQQCVDSGNKSAGTSCGSNQVCDGSGACVACTAGAECSTNPNSCFTGVTSCVSGMQACVDNAARPAGTTCGTNQVCSSLGTCVACNEGTSCAGNPSPGCFEGVISCASGGPVCINGATKTPGTTCGASQVCNAAGQCISCTVGMACGTNANAACASGVVSCSSGTPLCLDGMPRPPGTNCGAGQVCDSAGFCGACSPGQTCGSNPNAACFNGVTSCTTGTTTCINGTPRTAGTSCGTNQVCDATGACVACTAGTSCTGNPSLCRAGAISCATGAAQCVDGAIRTAGTTCGTNQVCDTSGTCVACTAGSTCSTNNTACKVGVTSCASGAQTCIDSMSNVTAGTACGTNQVCNGSGTCVACTAGGACSTNPNVCRLGSTSCTTGSNVCVDSGSKPAGTSCGSNLVCDGSGSCVSCTAGMACAGNPNPSCLLGVTSCSTGIAACIDGSPRGAGSSCGTNQVCNGSGSCVACTSGLSCSSNPNAACAFGVTSCNSGSQVCVDGSPRSAGQACGSGQVCNGSGSCIGCNAGLACSTNPGAACFVGITSCTTGTQTCIDGATRSAGTTCGTNQVCNGSGTCVSCTAGTSCSGNPNVCRVGTSSCATGATTCVDSAGNVTAGTGCGTNQVCNGSGSCIGCVANATCSTNPAPCKVGATSCATGAQTCVDGASNVGAGTSCGTNLVCNGSGACVSCSAGTSCSTNPNVCRTGLVSCTTGAQVCTDAGNKPGGTTCGTNQVCNGSGTCVACTAGAACTTNPNPSCFNGVTSCGSGAQTCIDGTPKNAGTGCGLNQVCNGSGSCVACTAGLSCSTNPNVCKAGVTSCTTGAQTCVDSTTNIGAGTSCGSGLVCDGNGSCGACVSGTACTGNANACFNGTTSCTTGIAVCVNGSPKGAGTSCGTNQVCDGSGACVSCTSGQSCTGNPNACRVGAVSCGSGAAVCTDTANNAAPGTTCGTNQVCNSSGTCVSCTSGATCIGNPTVCRIGAVSCASGASVCVDSGNSPAGSSCGTNQVCNGSGTCVSCTAGQACSTNPNACMQGVISCSSGTATCVDSSAPVPAGTDPRSACGLYTCNGGGGCSGTCSGASACSTICKAGAFCNGSACVADVGLGAACSSSCACTSGTCGSFHADADGDGFGAPATSTVCSNGSTPPPGFVTSATDCCDSDARAKPGGSAQTSSRIGCGGFDFDCNGTETKSIPSVQTCSNAGSCASGEAFCGGSPGWTSSSPACGVSASFTDCGERSVCNQNTCPGCTACSPSTSTQTQSCR